jgi:hypothetical protein
MLILSQGILPEDRLERIRRAVWDGLSKTRIWTEGTLPSRIMEAGAFLASD